MQVKEECVEKSLHFEMLPLKKNKKIPYHVKQYRNYFIIYTKNKHKDMVSKVSLTGGLASL